MSRTVRQKIYGGERIFQGPLSTNATSTQLEGTIGILRDGDKLVVTKLDMLARNLMHIGEILQLIKAEGAGLVILSLGSKTIDATKATGKLVFNMIVFVAHFKREMMEELQVKGIKRAQAKGLYKNRVLTNMRHAEKVKALAESGVGRVQVMEQLGMSIAS